MTRRAIVTGSDSDIGRATAVQLARDGFDVGITWQSDRAGAEDTAREVQALGRQAIVTHLDVTSFEDAADTVEFLAGELGGLDLLVTNSSEGALHRFLELPLEDWQRTIDVNLTGAFVCAQRAARIMVEAATEGRIVNVTSVHEHVPVVRAAADCAAKGGLGLLTRVMAVEMDEHGISANSVAPGECASADEVAEAIASLARPDTDYVSGSSLVVDGDFSS